ncbi:MAG: hypothetical protein RSK76_10690, partial [Clostridia bacterium]
PKTIDNIDDFSPRVNLSKRRMNPARANGCIFSISALQSHGVPHSSADNARILVRRNIKTRSRPFG